MRHLLDKQTHILYIIYCLNMYYLNYLIADLHGVRNPGLPPLSNMMLRLHKIRWTDVCWTDRPLNGRPLDGKRRFAFT
jgi:hypothetical protein